MHTIFAPFVMMGVCCLSFSSVLAGVVTNDLCNTKDNVPTGWAYSGLGAYADGSLKMDGTGDYIVTQPYSGTVTNLMIELKGNQTTEDSYLTVCPGVHANNETIWSETAGTNIVFSKSIQSYACVFPAPLAYNRFKLIYHKDIGNLGVYSVVASFVDGVVTELLPPEALPVDNNEFTDTSFQARWKASPSAAYYELSLIRTAKATEEAEGFDTFPTLHPVGWTFTDVTAAYETDAYSGHAPHALKIETNAVITTKQYVGPIQSVSFWYKANKQEKTNTVQVYGAQSLYSEWVAIGDSVALTNSSEQTVFLPVDGTLGFHLLKFAFDEGTNGVNIAIDDIAVIHGAVADTVVLDDVRVDGLTTNLTGLATGTYAFYVRAARESIQSIYSNTVRVDLATYQPPVYAIPLTGSFFVRAGAYTNDFNMLPSTNAVWQDARTMNAWYALKAGETITEIKAIDGSANSPVNLYSLSMNVAEDRALGSKAMADSGYMYGVAFTNTTAYTINTVTVSYVGVQRWDSGNETSLNFAYRIGTSVSALNEEVDDWVGVDALTFVTPAKTGSDQVLETGLKTATLPVVVPPGGVITMRWEQLKQVSAPIIGIDDVTVAWTLDVSGAFTLRIR